MSIRSLNKQSGLNLIELMISIVIGLFISLMVVQYLSTSTRLFKQQGADINLQTNGTFALSFLSQYVRMAGTNNPIGTDVPFYLGGCSNGPGLPNNAECTYNTNQLDASDRIAVQLFPFDRTDCTNTPVGPRVRIANVFFVRNGSLWCQGYDIAAGQWLGGNNGAVDLIDGVEQMQVLYGLANGTGLVNRYVNASNVAPGGAVGEALDIAWDQVRSVKVALLVTDTENVEVQRQTRFQLLDSAVVTRNDRIPRQVFSTTIMINNKLP